MWCVSVIIFFIHHQKLTTAYTAAVVEFNPETAHTPQETILRNLNEYKLYTERAKNGSADIVVFPEYGLTNLVENPEGFAIEISSDTPLVQALSILAKEQKIYLVVNLLEKVGGRRTKYYNTNLVFDRNGDTIIKYRKINLFGEPNLAAGSPDQNSSFTTDFGVTFATFTCFDILYRNPSRTVLQNGRVTDVVYPTSWFSTLPFYHSLSVQHGYSSSAGVTLLAANLGDPANTHGGSGIYSTRGAKMHIIDVPKSKLLTQDVSKTMKEPRESQSNMSNYQTLRDFKASDYQFKSINLGLRNQTRRICYKRFCCSFEIVLNEVNTSSDFYKIMAFDGVVPFDQSTAHIRVCSLLLCSNDSNESCGLRVKPNTAFTKIRVNAHFGKNTNFYNPVTLDFYLRPLTGSVFSIKNDIGDAPVVELSTVEESRDVLVFGLFGRID